MTRRLQRPHLAAYCLVRSADAILMQRRFDTGYLDGFRALPSGFVENGEDALAAASRELAEETGLRVGRDDWRFVCAMHRRTTLFIIDLFFETRTFTGVPRICEPVKCDGLAFHPIHDLPQPLAGYVGTAIACLTGPGTGRGAFHAEGWS